MKLARFARPQIRESSLPVEACELCGARLAEEHAHLVDLQARGLLCACRPCWLTMQPSGAGGSRFRCVPDRVLRLGRSTLDGAWWNSLQIPVGLIFLFRNSAQRRVIAFYPSPAGATEAAMATSFWDDAVRDNPLLETLAADVEALLVRRDRQSGEMASFIVPIDVCYELTGLIRRHWRGFDGGDARPIIDDFFERLAGRAKDVDATVS